MLYTNIRMNCYEIYGTSRKVVAVFYRAPLQILKFEHVEKQLEAQVFNNEKEILVSKTCPSFILYFFVLFELRTII